MSADRYLTHAERRQIGALSRVTRAWWRTAKLCGVTPSTLDRAMCGGRMHRATIQRIRASVARMTDPVVHRIGGLQ